MPRPWVKGQSGNPAGRPRAHAEFRRMAARLFNDEFFQATQIRIREGKENPAIVGLLMKYAFGSPDAVQPGTSVGVVVQTGLLANYQEQEDAIQGQQIEAKRLPEGEASQPDTTASDIAEPAQVRRVS